MKRLRPVGIWESKNSKTCFVCVSRAKIIPKWGFDVVLHSSDRRIPPLVIVISSFGIKLLNGHRLRMFAWLFSCNSWMFIQHDMDSETQEVYTRNNSQATLIYHSYFLVKHKSCSLVQQLSGFVPCIYMIFAKLGFLIIWWIQSSKDSVRRNFCQSVCVYSSLAGEYSAVMISRKRLLHVRNCNRNECYWTAVIN